MLRNKTAVIGGGTGFIGKRLVKLLTESGYSVTIISRMPGLNRITWHDLENDGLPKMTKAVVNLAGQNVLDPARRWTPGFKQNVWNSRINSTASIVKAIGNADHKPDCFINISGVSLYRPNPSKTYTEHDNGENYDFMSKLCMEWENAARIPDGMNCRLIKIRSGVVLGREGGMINSLIIPFFLGVGGKIASGTQHLPWIHADDLCRLIQFSIENSKVEGVLNGVAPDIITNETFTKVFASSMTRPALFPLPEDIIKFIFGSERSVLLTQGAKIKPHRVEEYGFQYNYPNIRLACKDVSRFFN